jgi:hypothetical protein
MQAILEHAIEEERRREYFATLHEDYSTDLLHPEIAG